MGEPLLRYDCVMEVCQAIKKQKNNIKIRMDTSGLFWSKIKRLDILDWLDILSVSLNAENSEKYNELCNPQIADAYDILMDFLQILKKTEVGYIKKNKTFPEVRLSVVDTSEEDFIPDSGRDGYEKGGFPIPDFDKCQKVASKFGWTLITKRLFRDSTDKKWNNELMQNSCSCGKSIDICKDCLYRH